MLISEQIKMRWSYRNRKHFESVGYHFTNINDVFTVKVEDLTPGSGAKVSVKCDYCGKEYECYYYSYVKCHAILNKDACQSCSSIKGREVNFNKRAKNAFNKLKIVCNEFGYKLITTIDEYTDIFMDINYICPKHGYKTGTLSNMINGHVCNECGNELIGNKLRHDSDYVKEYIENFNGNILLNPCDYINGKTRNLKIQCGTCKNMFTISFNNYKRMPRKQCRACSRRESEGEEIIRKYLTDKDIYFIQEKTFAECSDKRPLPFDFYLPKYNLCIEFDGEQHYKPTYGQDRYEATVLHDKIKNNYCKNNSINLLRIPYWNGHHINTIIDDELNRIKI